MLRMRYLAGVNPTQEELQMARVMRSTGGRLPGGKKTDNRSFGEVSTPMGRCWGGLIIMFGILLIVIAAHRGHEEAPGAFKPLDEVRWGIIGCGDVAESKSGPALQLIPHSRLVMVMRRNATLAEDFARRHGVPRWTNKAKEVIEDPEVNAIYVATPPRHHAEYAMMAARAGKAVYVEKPMGSSHSSGREMVREFAKRRLPLHVAYHKRALPNFLKIKELMDSGVIGHPRAVHVEYHRGPTPADLLWAAAGGSKLRKGASLQNSSLAWRTDPLVAGRGGYFRDRGSHQLDLLAHWFGPIVSVSGTASNEAGLYPTDDTVVANFKFSNGVMGTGSWCFAASHSGYQEYAEITGSKGKIRFQFFKSTKIEVWSEAGHEVLDVAYPRYVQQPLLETVVKALRGEGESLSTGNSAVKTSFIIDQILDGAPWALKHGTKSST